jgi:hypothetical protein
MMEGAVWRDPERVDDWIGELSKTEPVVTFCVYGFHIGCETAVTLRKAGFDARYMAGAIMRGKHQRSGQAVRVTAGGRSSRSTRPRSQQLRVGQLVGLRPMAGLFVGSGSFKRESNDP